MSEISNYKWCITDNIIKHGKKRIEHKDKFGLKGMLQEIKYEEIKRKQENISYQLNYSHIHKSLFLHSCIKGNIEIIIFLVKVYFDILSLCDQLALRQNVYYGKYLLPKDKKLIKWYNDFIIPVFRFK